MAKAKTTVFFCKECGFESSKWLGQCPACKEWNTLVEEPVAKKAPAGRTGGVSQRVPAKPVKLEEVSIEEQDRIPTGYPELDRVLGSGIVAGSLVLVGGDPGIGKSTLLLQMCRNLARDGHRVLYISGEESLKQIKMRASRIGTVSGELLFLCETNLDTIEEAIRETKPEIVIIDSIQTMFREDVASAPGSVSQVRESTSVLMQIAKGLGISVFIVGHVTKEGVVAGPRVLEHMVDTVLYFEGERNASYRILRGVKNRFGSTNEIGVFEMTQEGLLEVENPSLMMLSGRPKNASGTCVACVMEGSRPILAEVQGLVTATGFGTPRRMSTGFDFNRMAMLIAVLEKRAGFFFNTMDAYINVVSGLRLDEPAADLSVAMALVSSLKDAVIGDKVLAFGEIGLAGEIRAVSHCEQRVQEAGRLGFQRCVIPFHNYKSLSRDLKKELDIVPVRTVRDAFSALTVKE